MVLSNDRGATSKLMTEAELEQKAEKRQEEEKRKKEEGSHVQGGKTLASFFLTPSPTLPLLGPTQIELLKNSVNF